MSEIKAKIVFEDGKVFEGVSFGAQGEKYGEVVFNTSMSGYQEILTDPSYKGQIVTMTYPLIGNYGINEEDVESRDIFLEAFIIKELSVIPSNFRSKKTLNEYLKENDILGIQGVDTRAITKHIRQQGELKTIISTIDLDDKSLVAKAASSSGLIGKDLVKEVIYDKPFVWCDKGKYKVVVLDCGVKYNILRLLAEHDCEVIVMPANVSAEEILKEKPDGIMLSNGPGDPAAVPYVVETVKTLIQSNIPIFGICLGHQMLGQALGGKTYKLKFGHHGGNQPAKDLETGRVFITVQNHGFCVDIDTLNKDEVEITHINLNDNTLEGIRHKKLPIFSVQFHPEYAPGPRDSKYLFENFVKLMEDRVA